jgi:hypothetical protein
MGGFFTTVCISIAQDGRKQNAGQPVLRLPADWRFFLRPTSGGRPVEHFCIYLRETNNLLNSAAAFFLLLDFARRRVCVLVLCEDWASIGRIIDTFRIDRELNDEVECCPQVASTYLPT